MKRFLVTKITTTTTTIEVEAVDNDAALDLAEAPENYDNWTFDEQNDIDLVELPDPEACVCAVLTGSWTDDDKVLLSRQGSGHTAACPKFEE